MRDDVIKYLSQEPDVPESQMSDDENEEANDEMGSAALDLAPLMRKTANLSLHRTYRKAAKRPEI